MNYKECKKEMVSRGHRVFKNGKYITIIPNNLIEYFFVEDVVKGFEDELKVMSYDHYNTTIYEAKFKIV